MNDFFYNHEFYFNRIVQTLTVIALFVICVLTGRSVKSNMLLLMTAIEEQKCRQIYEAKQKNIAEPSTRIRVETVAGMYLFTDSL
jgi:hypothetical protein